MPIDALSVSCVQLTRDLLAIAKFLFTFLIISVCYFNTVIFSNHVCQIQHINYCLRGVTTSGLQEIK